MALINDTIDQLLMKSARLRDMLMAVGPGMNMATMIVCWIL